MFELLGRFHVVVVHFPIALLIVGGGLELLGLRAPNAARASAARTCIALGAASAVVAAVLGWIHADHVDVGSSQADTLALHRWLGIATALFACSAVSFGRASASSSARAMRLASVALATGLVAYTGHLGGTLVYGAGYFSSAFEGEHPVEAAPSATPASAAASEFEARIRPIFEARCYECHGERKQKGKLRFDRLEGVFEPREDGAVIVRGDPDQSVLIQRVTLPEDDEDHMPPKKSGPPLSPEEIELLRRWIEGGAPTS
jgi:uncharacterized membrane protein